jgi:hypothetical protein
MGTLWGLSMGFILIALSLALWPDASLAVLVGVTGLLLLQLLSLNARVGPYSSSIIPVVLINLTIVGGGFLWPYIEAAAIVSVTVPYTKEGLVSAGLLAAFFTSALTIGACIPGRRNVSEALVTISQFISSRPSMLLMISLFVLSLNIWAGWGSNLRGTYLEFAASGPLLTAAVATLPVGFASAAALAYQPTRIRLAGAGLVLVFFVLALGRATRWLGLFPLLLLVGFAFAGKKVKLKHSAIAATLSFVLLPIPLLLRANPEGVGIANAVAFLPEASSRLYSYESLVGTVGNVAFSAPLTSFVSEMKIASNAFWTSVSPFPSRFNDWPTIQGALRVDQTTPFNSLGELGSQGPLAVFAIGILIGLLFSLVEREFSSRKGLLPTTGLLLTYAVALAWTVSFLQYNLRSSTRLVWYLLAFALVSLLLLNLAERKISLVGSIVDGKRPSGPVL